ncbi:MAG TPA: nicotinate (nicotinamide) nucleotide adenylyltransferase [Bacteroidales bacterium]|jgi:nicotinate-nucleotide adenylyltransferase|nr:nicotinate (nicotinamide) nucleotide adenylyltransferase [Bacteroidales bacterium]HOS57438.1 nicotinate (nicotinamide) nucleotide adenylyltransferase [Bacteroidales bacterium]HPY81237.1 nicotinate (nicotinamide) nucleotide adenylyltransferase [Bacteroidales bacterium]HQA86111.1 nicotinate (nicotinamide) nucleotide adenylyltransferase [Bacteroidales bacterium]HRT13141.1 nicotinate (nicotinamide) nucleotide adenylyltransferase [Bacteroidales bacterium]
MSKIGLFFGSFNPIHIGHLIVAEYMVEFTDLKEVWFVVSPSNPLKKQQNLLDAHHRLYMVRLAIEDDFRFRASDVEFKLPYPSYTTHTLLKLEELYPDKKFALIMGEDNIESLEKWKNYQFILDNYSIYVYPRQGKGDHPLKQHPSVIFTNAPQIEISATFIRNAIRENKKISYFLLPKIEEYIDLMGFYRKK